MLRRPMSDAGQIQPDEQRYREAGERASGPSLPPVELVDRPERPDDAYDVSKTVSRSHSDASTCAATPRFGVRSGTIRLGEDPGPTRTLQPADVSPRTIPPRCRAGRLKRDGNPPPPRSTPLPASQSALSHRIPPTSARQLTTGSPWSYSAVAGIVQSDLLRVTTNSEPIATSITRLPGLLRARSLLAHIAPAYCSLGRRARVARSPVGEYECLALDPLSDPTLPHVFGFSSGYSGESEPQIHRAAARAFSITEISSRTRLARSGSTCARRFRKNRNRSSTCSRSGLRAFPRRSRR